MKKMSFEAELIAGMQQELVKQASSEPNLVKAAECLHAALEIFEEAGLQAKADQVLQVLETLSSGSSSVSRPNQTISIDQLMRAGVTQRDLREFSRGSQLASAKINMTLRKLGFSDREIAGFIGSDHVISEDKAQKLINPNETTPILELRGDTNGLGAQNDASQLETLAQKLVKTPRKPSRPGKVSDRHTKGLTPEKEVENLKHHGTPFNMADDSGMCVPTFRTDKLTKDDLHADFAEVLDLPSFDMDASDDQLLGMEIHDSLEVTDQDVPMPDFEDERNS
jgi:hypothetical protein